MSTLSYAVRDFASDVIDRSRTVPVLVDFWAEWCGPCRILGPVIERLAGEANGAWELKKLNTEEFPDIAQRYGIRSIPNVKLFVDGKPVNEFVGALPEPQIRAWLAKALPDRNAATLDTAETALHAGDRTEAAELLKPILQSAPHHERARVLMAMATVFGHPDAAEQMVTDIDEGSKFGDLGSAVRTLASLVRRRHDPSLFPEHAVKAEYLAGIEALVRNDLDGALAMFIQVIRNHRPYDDDGSRKACIAIFKLLGDEHEITLKHRRDFGSALYV